MLKKIYEFLYDTIIINIIKTQGEIFLYIEIYSEQKLKNSVEKTFVLNSSFKPKLLKEYLKPYMEETPFFYISLLDYGCDQGVIPTCKKDEMSKFYDTSLIQYVCDNSWAYYTSKMDLKENMEIFEEVGLDYVFSPFLIVKSFFADKITSAQTSMFILAQNEYLVISIWKDSQLLFGDYICIDTTVEEIAQMEYEDTQDEEEDDTDSIDLDDIDADDSLEDIDDTLGEIDDLDSIDDLDDIDNFADTEALEEKLDENLEDLENETDDNESKPDMEFNDDYQRFLLIQSALKNFYSDERYQSDFVQSMYVATSITLSNDFKRYMEEELFLNTYIRSIDISYELCEITKKEVFGENNV